MRCDAENGGSDRKAHLLVPQEHVEHAKEALHKYLHALKVGSYTQSYSRDSTTANSNTDETPRAIYIPSQAVRANLDFLKTFTSVEIWKNAPASVRNTPNDVSNPNHFRPQTRQQSNTSPKNMEPDPDSQKRGPVTSQTARKPATHETDQFRSDDATIGTSESTTSRTASFFSAQTNRFQELESQIRYLVTSYENSLKSGTQIRAEP